ncbi:MAG TPA: flippase [Patescibacteria group bacterium]|jgi:O-antigen/teichoic acid export membrane protein|nr:flippase [Patescibacteria group bacterium]
MLHIGRNVLSLIVSRILAGVILFLIYTRLVQYLGPAAAGEFGLLSTYLTVFSFFVDLGMSQLVIKRISEDREHAAKYLSNYFVLQFLLGFGFMLILDSIVYFAGYPQEVKNALYIIGCSLLIASLSLPFRSVINGFQRLTVIARINFLNSVINGSMMILAITLRKHLIFLASISLIVSSFDFFIYWYFVNRNFVKFSLSFDKQFAKQLLIATFPFALLTIFSIYNRVDTLLLPHLRNFEETGYYSAAYKFWDVLAFIPTVVGISLYPYFAESISLNLKDRVRSGLETYTRYMIAVGIPMAVGAYLLAPRLTLAFYGKSFLPAAPALWLLVTAVAILFIYSPSNSLVISQQTKLATKITGFTLLTNVVLNLILIPKFGFVAAAAVTVLSELMQALAYRFVITKKIIDYKFFRFFVKPAIAAAAMAGVVLLLEDRNIWLIMALSGICYTALLLLLRFFKTEDWELLKAAINIRKPINPQP